MNFIERDGGVGEKVLKSMIQWWKAVVLVF